MTADRGKHTPHLTIASLMDDGLNYGTPLFAPQDTNSCRRRHPVFKEDPGAQLSQPRCIDCSDDLCVIDLVDLVARMEQLLRQSPIVCNEQKPLRIGIEPPHRVEPRRKIGQEIEYRFTPSIIACRREISARLVDQDVEFLLIRLYTDTIDSNHMTPRVKFTSQFRNDRAVHRNPSRANHFFCRTTRRYTCMAENLLQSFFHFAPYRTLTALSPMSVLSSCRTAADPSIQ